MFFFLLFVLKIIDVTFVYRFTNQTLKIMKRCNDVPGSLASTKPDTNMLKNKQ